MVQILTTDAFFTEVQGWVRKIPEGARRILAVAGAPGSGKSTLAAQLVDALNADTPGTAAILALDGFHLDDEVLVPRGDRPRKGAPHTFDTGGFGATLDRLRANTEAEVAVPRFDRDLEISRGGARIIPQATRLIVAEGNYLLLGEQPWQDLAPLWDVSAWLDVALPELRARLIQRWLSHGFSRTVARQRTEQNDLKNVHRCLDRLLPADIVLEQPT